MTVRRALTYCELDLRRCSLDYGTAPCTAAIGVTGTRKCYNSPKTCQDPDNFSATTLTLRFAMSTQDLPPEIPCIPSLKSVSTKPQVLNPGESLGERESVTVAFEDHPFNDVGIDKYHADRGFDPYQRGTFWSKFVARWPYIQGSALRIIRGYVGDALEDMETRHYIVEDTSGGPDANGNFSITAKDPIKLFDADKAQAPRASTGVLASAIDDNDSSLTLEPTGVGNDEYPASGVYSMGDEWGTFTRSGDNIALTSRNNPSDHEEGETFQLGIFFDGEDAADILYELATGYTDIDPAQITLPDWQAETNDYIDRQYSRRILRPESVKDLFNELISQVGLLIYSDVINQKIILKALREFTAVQDLDDSVIIKDSLDIDEQPDKRVSQVWTFYGQENPLEKVDEEKNYRVVLVGLVDDSVATLEQRKQAVRKIYSRWISVFNRPAAESLNNIITNRYKNAPRKLRFQLPITEQPTLGAAITVSHRLIQDEEGTQTSIRAQIVSLDKTESRWSVVAEEMTFVQEPAPDHIINIDANTYNFKLRTAHDQIYADAQSGDNIIVTIAPGVTVGSKLTGGGPAFYVGDWPAGVNITIINKGRIQGNGGDGGVFGNASLNGSAGGLAFRTDYPVTLDNSSGQIWGGGGGGAGFSVAGYGGSGGGGAGTQPGRTVAGGIQATSVSGGQGSTSIGKGGGPGLPGEDSPYGQFGGAAGFAIQGESFITFDGDEGDIRGGRF